MVLAMRTWEAETGLGSSLLPSDDIWRPFDTIVAAAGARIGWAPNLVGRCVMEWKDIQRALVIFAHPDDAEFGSAGTSARLAREGKDVFYCVVTDGSKGSSDPNVTPRELIDTRRKEQCDAAEIVGVKDVSFLGFEDGVLQPTIEVRKAVTAAIRRFKPDIVICPSPERNLGLNLFVQHPDHLATGEAALAAIYPCARDRMTFPDLLKEGLEPHAVKEVWITGTGANDFYVDITSTIDVKVKALQAHASQVGHRDVAEFIPDRSRQLAESQDMEYAEAFKRIVIP
jgi:LmbE family N-acetylglucosaminyl deacetylase